MFVNASETVTRSEAEGVTPKQLAEMQARRPWDQYVVLQLARNDASTGELAAAADRISALGAPGLMIRDARLLLAQVIAAHNELGVLERLLTRRPDLAGSFLPPETAR